VETAHIDPVQPPAPRRHDVTPTVAAVAVPIARIADEHPTEVPAKYEVAVEYEAAAEREVPAEHEAAMESKAAVNHEAAVKAADPNHVEPATTKPATTKPTTMKSTAAVKSAATMATAAEPSRSVGAEREAAECKNRGQSKDYLTHHIRCSLCVLGRFCFAPFV
jgi:hypothetical protein